MPKAPTPTREDIFRLIEKKRYRLRLDTDIPEELRSDPEVLKHILQNGSLNFDQIPESLYHDRSLMFDYASKGSDNLQDLPENLRGDLEFVKTVLEVRPSAYQYATESVRLNKPLALKSVADSFSNSLAHVPEPLNRDIDVLTTALGGHTQAFMSVPEDLRNTPELLELAIVNSKGNSLVFKYFPEAARADRETAMRMLSQDGHGLPYASEALRDDKALVLTSLNKTLTYLDTVSERLLSDPDIIDLVINHKDCRRGFRHLNQDARNKREIVLTAVGNGAPLNDVDVKWQDDEDIVRTAVSKWGRNYQWASDRLKQSRTLTLLAAQDHLRGNSWGFDLSWVPEGLRNDRELVSNAITSVAKNAKHLTTELLADLNFVRSLTEADSDVLQYLPEDIQRQIAKYHISSMSHRGRQIIIEGVPEQSYVQNKMRTLDLVQVTADKERYLSVSKVPVITYESDGPVGSYLSTRMLHNIVLCGDFIFLVGKNSGAQTMENHEPTHSSHYAWSTPNQTTTFLNHKVWLVTAEKDATLTFEELVAQSSLIYSGLKENLPSGACVFPSSNSYRTAMSMLTQTSARPDPHFKKLSNSELETAEQAVEEVAGAARIYTTEHGWRWLIPNTAGPEAASTTLNSTSDADDWAWLSKHLEGISNAQKELLILHFENSECAEEVRTHLST